MTVSFKKLLFSYLFILSPAVFFGANEPTAKNQTRHVIIISLDGFPAYSLRDAYDSFPAMKELIANGAFADGMKPVNPTVTWPNHIAIVTGFDAARNGILYNGLPIRPGEGKPLRIEPPTDKRELVSTRTVYDAAHDAGLTTAEVAWAALPDGLSFNWSFGEEPHDAGIVEREMIGRGVLSPEQIRKWSTESISQQDEIWVRATTHIIEKHKPNLLMLHLLASDTMQHLYGSGSTAAKRTLIEADNQIRRVVAAVDRGGMRNSTTILVISDHGFRNYQHLIHPNALLRKLGLLHDIHGEIECDGWTIAEGGTAMFYVTRESRRVSTLAAFTDGISHLRGVAQLIFPSEYSQYGYPKVTKNGYMADIVLAAASTYGFDNITRGEVVSDVDVGATPGNHGYLNSDINMNGIFVASGAGIRRAAHLGIIPNVDVAPTIAQLLHVQLGQTQGSVLTDILQR